MSAGLTVTSKVHFATKGRGQRRLLAGAAPVYESVAEGSVPRVARLMALAIKLQGLIRDKTVTDQAELARLGRVTRARLTQIMNLCLLSPDLQEAVLHLPSSARGRDRITEVDLRPIVAEADWSVQRRLWARLTPNAETAGERLRA